MTTTLISLISIAIGIIGANLTGFIKKKSFDFIGNTIAGTSGGIFFIKAFSRIGFDPVSIMSNGEINYVLLVINLLVSFFGGVIGVFILNKLKGKMNSTH